jgi:hypothetical protein
MTTSAVLMVPRRTVLPSWRSVLVLRTADVCCVVCFLCCWLTDTGVLRGGALDTVFGLGHDKML